MSWLTTMSDAQLAEMIVRLRADVDRFDKRIAVVAADIDSSGQAPGEDPLYRRLDGIRQHLSLQLAQACKEASLRQTSRPARPSSGFWRRLLAPMRYLRAFTTGDEI